MSNPTALSDLICSKNTNPQPVADLKSAGVCRFQIRTRFRLSNATPVSDLDTGTGDGWLMKTIYSAEMQHFIRENVDGRTNAELAELVNERFGTAFSPSQMKEYKSSRHLSGNTRRRCVENYPREVEEYIANNYGGCSPREMSRRVNKIFGFDFSADQIRTYYRKHGLRSGCKAHIFTGEIKKYILDNYAEIGPKRMAALVSEKFDIAVTAEQMRSLYDNHDLASHAPHGGRDILPVGHEKRSFDGSVLVKVSGMGDNAVYVRKHRLIWEQAHGSIPEGSYLVFLDGDKSNCQLENLRLVTRQEFSTLVHQNLLTSNPDANESAILIARIRATIKNRSKVAKKPSHKEKESHGK